MAPAIEGALAPRGGIMQKKIATLEVWVTDEPGPSHSIYDKWRSHGKIILRTKSSSNTTPVRNIDDLADVYAHELGHFVQESLGTMARYDSYSDHAEYAMESDAWNLAEKMRKIDPELKDSRLSTYVPGWRPTEAHQCDESCWMGTAELWEKYSDAH
jgi:hypothetical protein